MKSAGLRRQAPRAALDLIIRWGTHGPACQAKTSLGHGRRILSSTAEWPAMTDSPSALDPADHPHRRLNLLTGEWLLVSPHRAKRPWQGDETAPLPQRHRRARPALSPVPRKQPGERHAQSRLFGPLCSPTTSRR
jgi:hypothetical protein